MSLLQQIKTASIEARKAKSPNKYFYVTLFAEAERVGKDKRNGESTDEEVIQTLKSFREKAEIMIQSALTLNRADAQTQIDNANFEISVIDTFLPRQMSESELVTEITKYVKTLEDNSIKQMGKVMTHLKTQFPGKYDGALASKLVKQILS